MIPAATRISRNPKVVHRRLGSSPESVLLHLESGAYFGLNSTGTLFWELLDGEKTFAQVAEEARSRLGEVPPDLEADLQNFLHALRERGLIELTLPRE